MKKYLNKSGKSGVLAYELLSDGIKVKFIGGEIYLYTFNSAGRESVLKMHRLAEKGKGLSTFISQVVKDQYEE